jgi:hypothetical protein
LSYKCFKKIQNGKIATGLYKDCHNLLAQVVCHSGIEVAMQQSVIPHHRVNYVPRHDIQLSTDYDVTSSQL